VEPECFAALVHTLEDDNALWFELGDLARQPITPGPWSFLGVRLREYQGMWSLFTTHMTAICPIPESEMQARIDASWSMRTEIKAFTVRKSSVDDLMQGLADKDRVNVEAKLRRFDERVFAVNFVRGDLKFCLFASFYEGAKYYRASVWTDDIVTLFGKNRAEISEMWEACDPASHDAEAARAEFLRAVNGRADADFTMTVTCSTWVPSSPSKKPRTYESASRPSVQYSIEDLRLLRA
jgi:hypothetical protein